MLKPFEAARYTGTGAWPMVPGPPMMAAAVPGHCRRCGEPSGMCRCGCRECRREAKELLVMPSAPGTLQPGTGETGAVTRQLDPLATAMLQRIQTKTAATNAQSLEAATSGMATAFIGGGCCVSLSVEYAASATTQPFIVVLEVVDSEGTAMLWGREENAGTPYRVKECVIATKPGANLSVVTLNATARVRWCEIFSCGC